MKRSYKNPYEKKDDFHYDEYILGLSIGLLATILLKSIPFISNLSIIIMALIGLIYLYFKRGN